jgi:hypothetical protein
MPLSTTLLGERVLMDFYARNGFRFLAIPASTDATILAAKSQQFRGLLRVDAARAREGAVRTIAEDHLDADVIMSSVARLENPRHRFLAELFWPHLPEGEFQEIVKARDVASPDVLRALPLDSHAGIVRIHRLHLAALAHHCRAMQLELDHLERATAAPDGVWEAATAHWRMLCGSEEFWRYLASRVETLDDFRLQKQDVERARAELPRVILAPHEVFATKYAAAQNYPDCVRQLRYILQSGFPDEVVRAAAGAAIRKVGGTRLDDLQRRAQQTFEKLTTRINCTEFDALVAPILEEAHEIHELLARRLEIPDQFLEQCGFDQLAETVRRAGNGKLSFDGAERERNLVYDSLLARRLSQLPLSGDVRRTLEHSRAESDRVLYARFGMDPTTCPHADKCFFLEGADADPAAIIVIPMYRITGREVQVNHVQRSGGISVAFETANLVIPRSPAARDGKAGATVKIRVLADEYTGTEREAAAELDRLERKRDTERAALERARADAIGLEEARRDADIEALRRREGSRLRDAEVSIAAGRRDEDEKVAAMTQRMEIEKNAIAARHEQAVVAARAAEAAFRRRLDGGAVWMMVVLPLAVLGGFVAWSIVGDKDATLPIAGVGAALAATLLAYLVRTLARWMMSSPVRAAERAVETEQRVSEATFAQEEKAIRTESAKRRERFEMVVAELERAIEPICTACAARLHAIEAESERTIAATLKQFEERAGQLESQLVRTAVIKAASRQSEFSAYRAAIKKGFKQGKEPTPSDMQMTEAERAQARMMLARGQ